MAHPRQRGGSTYRTIYKIPYRELHSGVLWETYIKKMNYTGSTTELTGTSKPTVLEYRPENDNDYDWIRPSICTIGMESTTDHQFIEFYTSDQRRYKIVVYRNSVLYWSGWLIPDAFTEPYIAPSYEVYITATDGLLSLKDVDWAADEGEADYEGKKSLMDGIGSCLSKIGIVDINVWESGNIYEQNHSTDSSPFSQTYFNCERFYDEDNAPMDCYTVLLECLKCQNCQIYQSLGYWNIVSQNSRKSTYTRRKWIWSGVGGYWHLSYSTSEDYNPRITVDNINYIWYADPELSFRPAWKKLSLKQTFGFDENILKHVDFNKFGNWNASIGEDNFIYLDYDNYQLNPNNYLEWDLGNIIYNADEDEYLVIEMKCYGSKHLLMEFQVILDGTTEYNVDFSYLVSDGPKDAYPWKQATVRSGLMMNMNEVFSERTEEFPIAGNLKFRIYQPHKRQDLTTYDADIQCATSGFYLSDIKIYLSRNLPTLEDMTITTDINGNNIYVPETIEMMLGDLPYPYTRKYYWQPPVEIGYTGYTMLFPRTETITYVNQSMVYYGGLYYKTGDTYYATTLWTIKDRNQYNKLRNVIADEIALNHLDPQWIISGDMYGYFDYGAILAVHDKVYMILRGSQNAYDKEWNLEIFEIADTEQGFLKLRSGGYVKLRGGGKIKIK